MEITAFGFEKHRKINEELVVAGGVWSGWWPFTFLKHEFFFKIDRTSRGGFRQPAWHRKEDGAAPHPASRGQIAGDGGTVQ